MHKLLHFRTLARTGNFNRASAELNLSQPSLTRSIQALEKQYGLRLLERQRGRMGIQLTQGGHELLRYADELLNLGEEMERSLTGSGDGGHHSLAFGIGPMLAGATLQELFLGLYRDYPGLEATVVVDSTAVMYPKLLAGDIEFYLGQSFGQKPSTRVRRLPFASTPARFQVRPEHPLAAQESVALADLAGYPRLSGTAWNDTLAGLPAHEAALLRATVQVDNFHLLAGIAASTDSIFITAWQNPESTLISLPVEFTQDPSLYQINLYFLQGMRLSKPAATAIERLRAMVKRIGAPQVPR
ncbi:LysR family transcriptional regulator [Arthrobacter mobilis]|uniref:LysR family transcriptional regulator n=1 Tax=Arthrobacter mobilis TaxID=2724944 RepID=A0A7X6K7G0_9MICC|nr:LysR family transcriptional regulator [Arthrobacter mobilis]NKX56547.1 LysR family transcriptional regulator [Arthrobacter mobilis]